MRNVSIEFLNELQNRMDFYYHADITFSDGSSVELGPDDLVVSGNSIVESAESTAFPLGNAIGKRLTLSFRNNEDQFSEYDFYNATIQLYLHFDLSENTEIINLGKYTVRDPETYGSTITLTAVDDMYKADTDFVGKNFPKTLLSAVLDCCSDCGLTLLTTRFANDDFVIQEAPTGITNRQFLGLCAMIAGGNALIDEYGRLKIVTYDLSAFERNGNYSGGIFDNYSDNEANVDGGGFFDWASGDAIEGGTFNYEEITQYYDGGSLLTGYYASGDRLNGGVFSPWEINPVYSGGTFSEQNNFHVFYKNQSPTIATDDVVITGVKIISNEVEYIYGTEGYVLTLENQLITGDATEAVRRIGELVVGLQFRPFTLDHVSYPLAEFGDLCYVIDRKNRVYRSIVTDVDFSLKGFTVLKCSADSPIRNSSKYNSNSTVQAAVQARKETKKEISEYDKAVQLMTSILSNSLGMFTTIEKTENGGEIIYQHNKPNLAESNIIWKKTENAFVVSTDGGETWNSGIDADGNAVVNVLSATGINFDWARGGTISLGGLNNKSGKIEIYDKDGNLCGIINNSAISFFSTTNETRFENGTTRYYTIDGEGKKSYIGYIGASQFSYDNDIKAVVYGLYDKNSTMGWASYNEEKNGYETKLMYAKAAYTNTYADTLNAYCNLNMHGYRFVNAGFNGAPTGTIKFVSEIVWDNIGEISGNAYKVKLGTLNVNKGYIEGYSVDEEYIKIPAFQYSPV